MAFQVVASTSDLEPGKMKTVDLNGSKVLLANAEGNYFALDDKCPHIGKSLSKGSLRGCAIECGYHHAQWDIKTGQNLANAKVLFLQMACKNAKTYPVKIEGNNILVDKD
jgi:3-phenylpropionate/trans-cinnamate dioxygenase ferredoxin subunit